MNKLRCVYTGGNVADGRAKRHQGAVQVINVDVPGPVAELVNHLSPSRLQAILGMFATFVNS